MRTILDAIEKNPINFEFENDYDKTDVSVKFQGNYEIIKSKLYIHSFSISVNNNTGKLIKVRFDESSISYNGKTSLPFIDGQKYSEAGNLPPNKIIPNGTESDFELLAANQVEWIYDNWKTYPMGSEATVVLAIEINSKNYYWIAHAKIRN